MTLLDGRELAKRERAILSQRSARLREVGTTPLLTIIRFGADPSGDSYTRSLKQVCGATGIELQVRSLESEIELLAARQVIVDISEDEQVHGLLIQTPIPSHIPQYQLFEAIPPEKDVDGVNPMSLGRLNAGSPAHVPATAAAVMCLLESTGRKLEGQEAVVVGRSLTVGRPVATLLLEKNATVTLCHSRTKNLAEVARRGDFLIVAVGKAGYIRPEAIKPGAVVIDVGINVTPSGTVGDVDPGVSEVAVLSPVPGGVGPLTNVMLLRNVLSSAELSLHT